MLLKIAKNTPAIQLTGKLKDKIHGMVELTDLEKSVINSVEFQRLRRLGQTSFTKYVFPGSAHSRFEHSIGVMHLITLMISHLLSNQGEFINKCKSAQDVTDACKAILETEKGIQVIKSENNLIQILRLAGLLHDIGHGPFSHSGEQFMTTLEEFYKNLDSLKIPHWLKAAFQKRKERLVKKGTNLKVTRIKHEVYSLMIISRLLSRYDENLAQDVCCVLDECVEASKGSYLEKYGIRTLFNEMVSGEIDADRMDYLLRDSKECGVIYGIFDLGRVLSSIGMYYSFEDKSLHLMVKRSGLPSFEDFLRARISMYQQVYFHKTSSACEAMFKHLGKILSNFKLPLDLESYIRYDDTSFYYLLRDSALYENNVQKSLVLNLLENLLEKRQFWKRVYEENIQKRVENETQSLCPYVLNYLEKKGHRAESIENRTTLTNMRPNYSKSSNKLKVFTKKMDTSFSLEPIEAHSELVNRLDMDTVIRRVFVECENQDEKEDIKRMLYKDIIQAPSKKLKLS